MVFQVKDRILDISVQLSPQNKRTILCLVGPRGWKDVVGKSSHGQQTVIVRMSLGGVRDESEIRGHRRPILPMPRRIIQGMKKAIVIEFLLDEIDKLGADWQVHPLLCLRFSIQNKIIVF